MRRLLLISVLAALSTQAGCAYFRETPPLAPQPAKEQVDADLPVPLGFALDRSRSLKHKRNDFRRLHLVYRAEEYLGEQRVREFLQRFFPEKGWQIAFIYGLDASKFIFWRDAEECRAEVREDFGDRYTELTIDVGPRKTPDGEFVGRSAWTPTELPASSPRK
ncbi:MAG: hypothetical protein D6731_22235 [Planctomycetota bacterium]|nr:MAG: hypothetical protein D6731_22235 [Planctomycetota bacterium]